MSIIELKIGKNGIIYLKKELMNSLKLEAHDVLQVEIDEKKQFAIMKKKLSVTDVIRSNIEANQMYNMSEKESKEIDKEINDSLEN